MAFLGKLPFGIAPGMGLNAFLFTAYALEWAIHGILPLRRCL